MTLQAQPASIDRQLPRPPLADPVLTERALNRALLARAQQRELAEKGRRLLAFIAPEKRPR